MKRQFWLRGFGGAIFGLSMEMALAFYAGGSHPWWGRTAAFVGGSAGFFIAGASESAEGVLERTRRMLSGLAAAIGFTAAFALFLLAPRAPFMIVWSFAMAGFAGVWMKQSLLRRTFGDRSARPWRERGRAALVFGAASMFAPLSSMLITFAALIGFDVAVRPVLSLAGPPVGGTSIQVMFEMCVVAVTGFVAANLIGVCLDL